MYMQNLLELKFVSAILGMTNLSMRYVFYFSGCVYVLIIQFFCNSSFPFFFFMVCVRFCMVVHWLFPLDSYKMLVVGKFSVCFLNINHALEVSSAIFAAFLFISEWSLPILNNSLLWACCCLIFWNSLFCHVYLCRWH